MPKPMCTPLIESRDCPPPPPPQGGTFGNGARTTPPREINPCFFLVKYSGIRRLVTSPMRQGARRHIRSASAKRNGTGPIRRRHDRRSCRRMIPFRTAGSECECMAPQFRRTTTGCSGGIVRHHYRLHMEDKMADLVLFPRTRTETVCRPVLCHGIHR